MSEIASNYYENFKKNYTLNSFKTRFASLYKAAIKDIKNHKESESFNYKSQKDLVEYYIYAKLVDTELLTKDAFDNLNKIIMMDDTNSNYEALIKLTVHDIGNTSATIKKNGSTNMAMSDIVSATLTDNISIYQNPYFLNLLLLLLTIRFYPFAILNNIYENGKYNIQSIKKNIETMTSQVNAIQNIVTTIESSEQVDPIIGTPLPIQDELARRIGLDSTLTAIKRVDANIPDLVEYSTKILYKALAVLSLSIGFSNINEDGGLLIKIMPSLIYSINTYFIAVVIDKNSTTNQKTISALQNLKRSLLALMDDTNNQNIIANISKIHSSMINRNVSVTNPSVANASVASASATNPSVSNASATNPSVANEDTSLLPRPRGIANGALAAYQSYAEDEIKTNVDLQALNATYPQSIDQATKVSNGIIAKYFKTKSLDEAYSKDIGNAIATIFAKYIEPYRVDSVVKAAEIAAEQAYNRKTYDVAVNKYLITQTKRIRPVVVGGALPDDYNYETNLQISIIKGIDSSAFFRLNNVSVTRGGQRTQKNRNKSKSRSSGGTRKNMNSIDYDL
jgi:hypothetical protein